MSKRKASSALVVAGAAVAASAAAAWLGSMRIRKPRPEKVAAGVSGSREVDAFDPIYDRLVERDSEELPIGHSADPELDRELFHTQPEDQTSGASLFGEPEQPPRRWPELRPAAHSTPRGHGPPSRPTACPHA